MRSSPRGIEEVHVAVHQMLLQVKHTNSGFNWVAIKNIKIIQKIFYKQKPI